MGVTLLPTRLPKGVQDAIGRTVGGLGITPNMVSMAGAAGNAAAAVLVARGSLLAAGIVYLVFSALDLVDGAVARATGKASPFGAVFDAVLDRASEAVVLAACAWYFAARGQEWQVGAAYAALLGSVAVSYLRARAEVEGVPMREGLFRRQERVAVLGVGLLLGWLTAAMVILAVLSNLTALQRAWMLTRALRADGGR
ncbi:CDP-alcohol phosphatidyltransferase family protein [Tepidiforma sp.]|jgi:CDP-diacylglycerol--glycerol-3-phosphate 3-phosphatidyltransferase|uniref:CDP-alcohol phosphatidyltransferase family protein n=1 Tax=Tepidiforma sp. TaxID=2682230 RepID=UPI0021DD4354|nr:CDP-alcohol phosphatidyltransferase family protein [Tepidiforma sp.]MCX7618582.1 CDP-alcohol phosphatidyltransferase family protein [Tepidiforma sp.]GIW18714.1 MAG: CDP-alcohol phosphatidyltransferase [Tepidiforma sp.]